MSIVIIYGWPEKTWGRLAMNSDTRAKMVAGAADLLSRRGVNATSVREVVRHSGTPRGSIGHHFPRGKQQLIEDAIAFAGAEVSAPLEHLMRERGAIAGLRAFIALWRRTLEGQGRGEGRKRAAASARSGTWRLCRLAKDHRDGLAARGSRRRARKTARGAGGRVRRRDSCDVSCRA